MVAGAEALVPQVGREAATEARLERWAAVARAVEGMAAAEWAAETAAEVQEVALREEQAMEVAGREAAQTAELEATEERLGAAVEPKALLVAPEAEPAVRVERWVETARVAAATAVEVLAVARAVVALVPEIQAGWALEVAQPVEGATVVVAQEAVTAAGAGELEVVEAAAMVVAQQEEAQAGATAATAGQQVEVGEAEELRAAPAAEQVAQQAGSGVEEWAAAAMAAAEEAAARAAEAAEWVELAAEEGAAVQRVEGKVEGVAVEVETVEQLEAEAAE